MTNSYLMKTWAFKRKTDAAMLWVFFCKFYKSADGYNLEKHDMEMM